MGTESCHWVSGAGWIINNLLSVVSGARTLTIKMKGVGGEMMAKLRERAVYSSLKK